MRNGLKRIATLVLLTTLFSTVAWNAPHAEACSCVYLYKDDQDVAPYARYAVSMANSPFGIMMGNEQQEFRPSAMISREEMAVVLAKALHLAPVDVKTSRFRDVTPNGWSSAYMEAVGQAGIMMGDDQGLFHPQDSIAREEVAALIVRAMKREEKGSGERLTLTDQDQVSTWARDAVQTALETGLMKGVSSTSFQPQAPAERQQIAVVMVNMLLRQAVQEKLVQKVQAIQKKDLNDYLATLDQESRDTYRTEQTHWFQDLIDSGITEYREEILDLQVHPPMTLEVTIARSYRLDGQVHTLRFQERYLYTSEGAFDSDLMLETLMSPHFIVSYPSGTESTAAKVRDDAERAYAALQTRYPHEVSPGKPLEIKLYNDPELLRQSVKLSFAWQFAGWYEYGESIKMSAIPGPTADYTGKIQHEMVHEVTIGLANNNLPYWLAEGLAVYYSTDEVQGVPLTGVPYMSIAELESINLETLTDPVDVSRYYNTAGNIVTYLAKTYGEDRVRTLVQELGAYPFLTSTTSEHDDISREHLRAVIPNVFDGKTLAELDQEWQQVIKKQFSSRN